MRLLSRAVGARVLAASVLMAAATTALPSFAGDTSTAEHLFQQGLDAMKAGRFKEACDAFAGSDESDPSPGTEINLALCNEKQDKLASAWGWYRTAAGLAEQRGQKDRAALARAEAAKLEPKMRKLAIVVKVPAEGLAVTRNGAPVPNAVLGTDVPVDPGEQTIEVSAKGKKPWKQTLRVASGPGVDRVEVPALEDAPREPPVARDTAGARPADEAAGHSTQRTVAYVVGGTGIVALLAAGGIEIFNLAVTHPKAKEAAAAAEAACNPTVTVNCAPLTDSAKSRADAEDSNTLAAALLAAAGGALLVTGIVLYVTAPNARSTGSLSRPLVVPMVGHDRAGIGLTGTF